MGENVRETISDKRTARALATHEAILAAAEALVLAEGRQALTTKRLVKEAQVSERTIFNHFDNIDAILLTRLSQHLADLLDVSAFPTDSAREDLPHIAEEFIIQTLQNQRSAQALDRFILLATTFDQAHETSEIIGQEVFTTVHSMSWSLSRYIQRHYFDAQDLALLELALYLQNMMTGMVFGMAKYMFENPNLEKHPKEFSNEQLRQEMIWGIQQVVAGQPRLRPVP